MIFQTRVTNLQLIASDTIGGWVVWAILGHPAETEQEVKLARRVGTMSHLFFCCGKGWLLSFIVLGHCALNPPSLGRVSLSSRDCMSSAHIREL